jgi:minor histocompatibility antigen H13
MLRFGAHNGSGKAYFYAAIAGYVLGLVSTLVAMNVSGSAQPALLYIVPAEFAAVGGLAIARGEFAKLWAFNEEEGEEPAVAEGGQAGAETKKDA